MKYLNYFFDYINEGEIKSASTEKAFNILKRQFPTATISYINVPDTDIKNIKINFRRKTDISKIIPLINNLGYFIFNVDGQKKYTGQLFAKNISIESKFFREPVEVPAILYHTTPTKYLSKILKIGLIPKSKSKRDFHPERIYLTPDIKFAKWFKVIFKKFFSLPGEKETEYSILEIDTSNLNMKLYRDPQSQWEGYYTTQNIPPSKIKVLE